MNIRYVFVYVLARGSEVVLHSYSPAGVVLACSHHLPVCCRG